MDVEKVYKSWIESGLLEKLNEEEGKWLACQYETLAHYLIKNEDKYSSRTTSNVFSVLRRIFSSCSDKGLSLKGIELVMDFSSILKEMEVTPEFHQKIESYNSIDFDAEVFFDFSNSYVSKFFKDAS